MPENGNSRIDWRQLRDRTVSRQFRSVAEIAET